MNNNLNFVDLSNNKCTLYLNGDVIELESYKDNVADQWFSFLLGEEQVEKELNIWKDYSNDNKVCIRAAVHECRLEKENGIKEAESYEWMLDVVIENKTVASIENAK